MTDDDVLSPENPAASDTGAPDDQAVPGRRLIGFWLKLLDRLIDERFAATLDEHGVTRRQWQLLSFLSRGPASQEELDVAVAPFLAAVDPDIDGAVGGTTRVELEELMESEWVGSADGAYALTPKGRQSVERLTEVVSEIREQTTSGIEDADYRTTVATLEEMATNLGWRETVRD